MNWLLPIGSIREHHHVEIANSRAAKEPESVMERCQVAGQALKGRSRSSQRYDG
ncbi:hypothetical protein J2X26_004314 [Cellulomonas humilata]|uniref:Uncharacterized protein n=1 Tax=Cellulomonas humilata TaxID=144055 RepID=A0ABU0EL10_9CELL|nr:hypothetical protein [Cellulomonas humilata]